MKAAVLGAFGRPLDVLDVTEPSPAPNEALVRVRAAGLCGTDLKIWEGAFDHLRLPLVPGHEIAGELVESVGGLPRGQRVACYLYDPCGACRWCLSGRPTLCPHSRRLGIERDGGFAEYVAVPAASLLPFGDALPFELAAVTMDAVMSPWHALVTRAQLRSGETVAVVGAGGLGLNGVQVAMAHAARVAVIEPSGQRRAAARAVGAERAVPPGEEAAVRRWAGDKGVDVAYEASGIAAGFRAAVDVCRPGGRVVCCGYRPGLDFTVESARLVLDEITVLGSRAGTPDDARAALHAVEVGSIVPRIGERLRLEWVNDALERLRAGDVVGRLVLVQDRSGE